MILEIVRPARVGVDFWYCIADDISRVSQCGYQHKSNDEYNGWEFLEVYTKGDPSAKIAIAPSIAAFVDEWRARLRELTSGGRSTDA